MATSSLAVAEGCNQVLAANDEILAEVMDWQGKKTVKDALLRDIFVHAGGQRCGHDWYSMNYGNVNILCMRCATKLGWRW